MWMARSLARIWGGCKPRQRRKDHPGSSSSVADGASRAVGRALTMTSSSSPWMTSSMIQASPSRVSSSPSWGVVSPNSDKAPPAGYPMIRARRDTAPLFPLDLARRLRFGSRRKGELCG